MEFFKRLHDFHEHVKRLQATNQGLQEIKSNEVSSFLYPRHFLITYLTLQIPKTQSLVHEQLGLIEGPIAEERSYVESELNSIEANFFAAERDRVREK